MGYHFIRYLVQRGALKLQYIRTNEKIAYILTKPMKTSNFMYFHDKLGMAENASLPERECWFLWEALRAIILGEWRHLVRDQGVESTQSWVTILLNGDIWSKTTVWNQSSTEGLNLELSDHSVEWGYLVRDQEWNQSNIDGLNLELSDHSIEWWHLV